MATVPPDALLEQLARAAEPGAAAERRRMLLIVNPHAATVSDRLRHLVAYALQGRYEVTATDTQARGHATEMCREAAQEGYDVVVAFGGDGTVNEAVNGLRGGDVALSCLPGGSANVFCKLLDIPGEIVDATEHLLRMADDWRPRRVDLGRVLHRSSSREGWSQRLFTFSSGLGLDADVVRRVDARPRLKARYGPWWFATAAVSSFAARYARRPPRLELRADGRTLSGVTAVVQNGAPWTYFNDIPIHLAEHAALDSGTLSGVMLERANPLDLPTLVWRLVSGRARFVRHRHVAALERLPELDVRTVDGEPVALQVDGDYVGEVAEARYDVIPRGLTVVA